MDLSGFIVERTGTVDGVRLQDPNAGGQTLLVGFTQEALKTQQDGLNIVDCTPFVLENVETYSSAEINVGMIDGGLEQDRRSGIRVVAGEFEAQFEVQIGVGSACGTDDGGCPV